MVPAASSYQALDPKAFASIYAQFGLELADGLGCDAARALAADLISDGIALALTFKRVQERTRSAVFILPQDDRVVGALGMIPINPEGRRAIEEHCFDPRNPPNEYLSQPGDPFAAVYGWGIAGLTRRASATVVQGVKALRDHFKDVPFYTRTATEAGRRVVCGRLGYAPFPGAPDDLLWNPVTPLQERAA